MQIPRDDTQDMTEPAVDDPGHGISEWIRGLVGGHSHDHAEAVDEELETSAQGSRAVKVSFVVLMVTALGQVLIVVLTGSVALLADTIHNFSDALTAIPLLLAFRLGRRPPSRTHTYGYHRAEDLAGLFIVAMIALSALLAGWESIQRLVDPRPIQHIGILFAAGLIGFLGNEAVALYRIHIGRQIGSAALVADGLHARVDGLTSLAVSAGAVGAWLGFDLADPIIGLVVTVAILGVLRPATRQVIGRLMDAVDPGLVDQIHTIVEDVDGILDVTRCQIRWLGHRLRADLDVAVDADLTVSRGHDIVQTARDQLHDQIRHLDDVHVHVHGRRPPPSHRTDRLRRDRSASEFR